MKTKQQLTRAILTHFNTKLIIAALAIEFIMLTVLFCVAGRKEIEDKGSYALREVLSNAGAASSSQYSEIVSGAEKDSRLEAFVSEYIADDNVLMSSLSPSLAGYINHEYNVKNYVDGVVGKNNNNVTPLDGETKPNTTVANYKFYQFVLGSEDYHSELIIDNSESVPAGVLVDEYDGKMIVNDYEDFNYGCLNITNPYHVPEFDLKKILETPLAIPLRDAQTPSVLLYYTHTSENYCVTENDKYAIKKNNSDDASRNVLACGEVIYDVLKNKYGVGVINKTDKNDSDYNNAYGASENLLKDTLATEKSIDLTIDIHRDGVIDGGEKFGPTVESGDKTYAQIMFVMGSGCYVGNKNYEDNMKLAMLLIEKMEAKVPGITRGMSMRKDTYLSDYANKGLLVEIGFSGNYTEEAKNTAEVFAEALGEVYGKNGR